MTDSVFAESRFWAMVVAAVRAERVEALRCAALRQAQRERISESIGASAFTSVENGFSSQPPSAR